MIIDFQAVSASEFAKMTKDPHVFYLVTSDASLEAGLYKLDGTYVPWKDLVDQKLVDVSFYTYGNYAYSRNDEQLQGILVFPDTIKGISKDGFSGCAYLTAVYLSDSMEAIGQYGFYGCTSLAEVHFATNTSINDYAFRYCSSLTSIEIPNTIIPKYAFGNCSNLNSVIFSSNLQRIQEGAFEDCISLTSIDLPSTIQRFDQWVFARCTSLKIINYAGTKQQWNSILKLNEWAYGTPSPIVHCSDGDIQL